MENRKWEIVLKGVGIGATMTVPGVSGGSMAMVLGIYEPLIAAISSFFRRPKESGLFLLRFCLGAAAGILLLSGSIGWLLTTGAAVPVRYFFLGAVAGGIPLIYRAAGAGGRRTGGAAYLMSGLLAALLLSLLPGGLFQTGGRLFGSAVLCQLLGGMIVAVALVLPGISAAQMLYMLGIYESTLKSISSLQFFSLVPLAAGILLGTFVTAGVLEHLLKRHPRPVFLTILGFLLASLGELFPGIPKGGQLLPSMAALASGFLALYLLGRGSGAGR